MNQSLPKTGKDGERYVPYEERTGEVSIVYFTRDLSSEGLRKIYNRVSAPLCGKVGIKLHTGEKNGPNIIPREWVKNLIRQELPDAAIIETNTYYEGDRYTTEQHRETLEVNGWTFCPVDIMDADGTVMLPVKNGTWFTEMSMGKNIQNYDSMLALTHFKGHSKGGFGGSNINVLRNMSVSCDCEGCAARPVVTPNIGITASVDILAVDQASVDLVYALREGDHKDLIRRFESRHGHRQLSYMKELGMGNHKYVLVDIDNDEMEISVKEAVKDVKPFVL